MYRGPHQSSSGKRLASRKPTIIRSVGDQLSSGPIGVFAQSCVRISSTISPLGACARRLVLRRSCCRNPPDMTIDIVPPNGFTTPSGRFVAVQKRGQSSSADDQPREARPPETSRVHGNVRILLALSEVRCRSRTLASVGQRLHVPTPCVLRTRECVQLRKLRYRRLSIHTGLG